MKTLRLLITAIVFAAVGIVVAAGGISDKIKVSGEKTDFSDLTADNLKSGTMVEGTIYEVWDEFAYEDDDGYTGYFAFPLDSSYEGEELYFAALKFSDTSDVKIAQKMSQETDNWYFNDVVPETWTSITFSGKVSKLKGDGLDFFHEYLENIGCDLADYKNAYVIERYKEGSETPRIVMGVIFAVLGVVVAGLAVLLRLVKGKR